MRATLIAVLCLLVCSVARAAERAVESLPFAVEAHAYLPATPTTAVLDIVSSADLALFGTVLDGFQARSPGVAINYFQVSSLEANKAATANAGIDLVISSAMDLQTKLANDGAAQPWRSAATTRLPAWARWRDRVIAFTEEPIVIVLSHSAFAGDLPRTRSEIMNRLREQRPRFRTRLITYDLAASGLAYLLATQDTRHGGTFWGLTELMGALDSQFVCCSGQMIDAILSGEADIAYNVIGSYARQRLSALPADHPGFVILEPEDYTLLMLRSALIPITADAAAAAGRFIDFLLSDTGRVHLRDDAGLPPLPTRQDTRAPSSRPIKLGPGLLVFLDRLKKRRFLQTWQDATQRQNEVRSD
ncbi:MAG: ABC transporter substrate-binding protein [Pseudomonadota bacterium]